MYRTIDTAMWHDPKFRALPAPGKLLFIYLITNPHAHVSGIYYLPDVTILHESGVKAEALNTLWDTLSRSELAFRDEKYEVVWVKNMLKRQGMHDKLIASARNHLLTLHNSPLIQRFREYYPSVADGKKRKGINRVSRPRLQEQEQEQDREEAKASSCGDPASAGNSPPPLVAFPVFDCVPGRRSRTKTWTLTDSHLAELVATFPGVDVPQECREAWGWTRANPSKRKTVGGMPGFLHRWLSKAQDASGGTRPATGVNGSPFAPEPPEVQGRRVAQMIAERNGAA